MGSVELSDAPLRNGVASARAEYRVHLRASGMAWTGGLLQFAKSTADVGRSVVGDRERPLFAQSSYSDIGISALCRPSGYAD
jgi:hypothetical protein